MHVEAIDDLADGCLDRGCAGQTHERLVLRFTRDQRVEDWVFAMGDALDVNHRLLTDVVDGSCDVHVGSFVVVLLGDSAPHHVFCIGRNDDTVGCGSGSQGPPVEALMQGSSHGHLI